MADVSQLEASGVRHELIAGSKTSGTSFRVTKLQRELSRTTDKVCQINKPLYFGNTEKYTS